MDLTHVECGADGWGHLAVVIDCHDREVIGWELALRGRAQEVERALGQPCLARFGTLRPAGPTPVLRSDNGLIVQSKGFRGACHDYRLKKECVWVPRFEDFAQARRAVAAWIRWYNAERPHQALGDRSPEACQAWSLPAA